MGVTPLKIRVPDPALKSTLAVPAVPDWVMAVAELTVKVPPC